VDLRLDAQEHAQVLEVNALPGILPDPKQNSCFPKAARASGLDYDRMILAVLEAALVRLDMRPAAGHAGRPTTSGPVPSREEAR
jgi:D-alanine-D-alanine ligase